MRESRLFLYLAICTLISVTCSVSRSYNSEVQLPDDTSPETAQKIIGIVVRGNFVQKIKAEFPYLTDAQLSGVGLSWRWQRMLGEKSRLSIVVQVKYGGGLTMDDAKVIAEYGKTIVEDAVRVYFDIQHGRSSQPV